MERTKNELRIPYITLLLVAVNVGFFIWEMLPGEVTVYRVLHCGGAYLPYMQDYGEWWRLLTACFLHFDPSHLGYNMLSLLLAGSYVERKGNRVFYLFVYLVAGVLGNLISVFVYEKMGIVSVSAGASGAVMAAIGLACVKIVKEQGFTLQNLIRPAIGIVLILSEGFSSDTVNNVAHVVGLASGILAGIPGLKVSE